MRNNRYETDSSKAHMKSYDFIQMISSNIPFSFEELEHIPTSLYDLSKCDIKDISAFTDKNFIMNAPKQPKKESKKPLKRLLHSITLTPKQTFQEIFIRHFAFHM